MTEVAEASETAAPVGILDGLQIPTGANRHKPGAFAALAAKIENAGLEGKIISLDAKRRLEILSDACLRYTGVSLEDASREDMDSLQRFKGLMETSGPELEKVEKGVASARGLLPSEKKRYTDLIRRTIALQNTCRDNPMLFWIYVGRDSETADVFRMASIHARFFQVWNDDSKPNSLLMAPPRHSKTTSMRGQILFEIAHDPRLRCLLLYDEVGKARKEVSTIKRYIRSDLFSALFPDVMVLDRSKAGEDSSYRFTVKRPNWMSREPTVEGAGISSRINGNGYDRIFADDICPEEVQRQPGVRRDINDRWNNVITERLRDPKNSRIRLICTPWDEDDVSGNIRRQADEGRIKNWNIAIDEFAIKDDANGLAIPIWDRFPVQEFEDRKVKQGAAYTLNYRLVPRRPQDRTVSKMQFYNSALLGKYTTQQDRDLVAALEDISTERSLSIDPSATANVGSSDTGITDWALTPRGFAFLMQVWSMHSSPTVMQTWIVDRIIGAIDEGRPYKFVLIEGQGGIKGMVSLWIDRIREILEEKGCQNIPALINAGLRGSSSGRMANKEGRLKECAPLIVNGLVKLAGERRINHTTGQSYFAAVQGSEIDLLRDRVVNFKKDGRTDGVDAVTQWILHNRSRIKNPNVVKKTAPAPQQSRCPLTALMVAQMEADKQAYERKTSGRGEEQDFLAAMTERNVA